MGSISHLSWRRVLLGPRENPCDIIRKEIFWLAAEEGHGHGLKVCGDAKRVQLSKVSKNITIYKHIQMCFKCDFRDPKEVILFF